MSDLFMAEVEAQVYKDWERRFNKRVIRRPDKTGLDLPQALRNLVAHLKRAS